MVIELTVVRRLFDSPRLVLLIATVGVAQLLLVPPHRLPEHRRRRQLPAAVHGSGARRARSSSCHARSSCLIVAPVAILALALFMTRTTFGLAVRASASNPDTARVYGISVKRTSTIVWTIAGAFAAVTAILVAPLLGVTPGNIVAAGARRDRPRAAAARAGRRADRPHAVAADDASSAASRSACSSASCSPTSTARPVDRRPLPVRRRARAGAVRRPERRDDTGWSLSAQVKPIPERLRSLWYVRRLPRSASSCCSASSRCCPSSSTQRSQQFLWTEILIFALVALSITLLTGWAGQLSLGQFAFVGLGALTMVVLARPRHPGAVRPLGHAAARWPWLPAVLVRPPSGSSPRSSRPARAAGARPVPRGDHARVRGHGSNWLFRQSRAQAPSSARRRRASTRR